MVLTAKQELGLKISIERYKNHEPYTCIAGYAGTGKTTLISHIVAALDLDPKRVCYVAYTGKAANVLKQKNCPNATTVHKLLYESRPLEDGTFVNIPKDNLSNLYSLIIVDEISMLPIEMWELMLTYGVPVIACGDPGQLPPIDPSQNNGVLDRPHVFLDEIMRQAKESEIIQLSMHIREGKPLSTFTCAQKQIQIFSSCDVSTGMYEWADQVICATNQKKQDINTLLRKLKGFPKEPQVGDKIIGMTNHWNFFSDNYQPLTNGTIGEIKNLNTTYMNIPAYIYPKRWIPILRVDMVDETEDVFEDIFIDYNALMTGEKTLDSRQEFQIRKNKRIRHDPPYDFSFGYAITCWKAQGSQWDKVMLFEEKFPSNREEHKRYLYTGITRAAEKAIIIRKD